MFGRNSHFRDVMQIRGSEREGATMGAILGERLARAVLWISAQADLQFCGPDNANLAREDAPIRRLAALEQ